MAEVTTLTLAVNSQQVRTATSDLDKLGKQGKRTERDVEGVAGAFRGLGAAVAAAAGSLVVREVIAAGDAYANLNARLRLVTNSAKEFATAQSEVFRIAQATQVGLAQTADLYASLARSTESLGVSQSDLLQVTESINQAILISGTSAAGASAALTQLGQGFASGVLRGEELNSVLEQTPRLARAIADGLGVTVGQLRALGAEGQLTSERVFQALIRSQDQLAREAAQLPLTVGRSLQQVQNSFLLLIGTIDQSTGATTSLAETISAASKFVGELATNIKAASAGAEDVGFLARAFVIFSQTIRILASDIAFIFRATGREIGAIAAQINALARLDFQGFKAISEAVRADAVRARAELDKLQRDILNGVPRQAIASNFTTAEEARRRGLNRPGQPPIIPLLQPSTPNRSRTSAPPISEAEQYLRRLRETILASEELSVVETLKRDIQLGRLGAVTAAQERELTNLARQIDLTNQQRQADQERLATIQAVRQATIDEFDAVQRANDEYQSLVESLIDATPTKQLERQRQVVQTLADEYERGRFGVVGSTEAVKLYGETVNEFLGNTVERLENTKSLSEEIGLSFTSAFEDAIVEGRKFSEVLRGLEQDILRIVTRKLVTEPLGNAITGALGGASGGIGSFFSSIFGSVFGRAIGGPVSRGGIYEVNERGPELLSANGRQFLMMGNTSGNVSPMTSGGGSVVNINVSVPVNSPRDRATAMQFGQQVARQLQMAQARNG